MQSATIICGRNVSTRILRRCSMSGYRPTGVALITMSVSEGMLNVRFHGRNEAFAGVRLFSRSANDFPLSLTFSMVISSASANAISTAIARAAPPAPKMTIFLPGMDVISEIAFIYQEKQWGNLSSFFF